MSVLLLAAIVTMIVIARCCSGLRIDSDEGLLEALFEFSASLRLIAEREAAGDTPHNN